MSSRVHTMSDFAAGHEVQFPLRAEGEVWYQGWDIPGHYAVDAGGRVFADFGAHGCSMMPSTYALVIKELESNGGEGAAHELRKMAGMKPALPSWMAAALRNGWTPPSSFKREEYE